MKPAAQIYSREFDSDFFALPKGLQRRIEERIDWLGENLLSFHHQKLKGCNAFKLRIGNYRVLYRFEEEKLILLAVGHRREVYRGL